MSLINQVLLDLEKRHAGESERPLPPHVRVVPGRPNSSIATSVFTGTALLVFIAIAVFVYYRSVTTSSIDVLLLKPPVATAGLSSPPLPVPPVPVAEQAQSIESPGTRMAAFDAVSKRSDELVFSAPHLPGKPSSVEHGQSPSHSAQLVSLPKAEKFREPNEGIPLQAEMAAKQIPHTKFEKPVQEVNTSVVLPASTSPAAIDKQMREIAP